MTEKINRRTFFKLTGLGAAAAVLTGCGPESRYVVRRPYANMPEYNQTGESTFYATTCRECQAGCGLIMRTLEGRAIKAEGSPSHPVNGGKLCSRGLVAVQGLYNPDRIKEPASHAKRGDPGFVASDWNTALATVKAALSGPGAGVAFYLGLNHDHLYDLANELAAAIGAPPPLRFGALGMFEGRATLAEACRQLFGSALFPYFDLAGSDLAVSFGAGFLETWLSPVAYSRAYAQFRRSKEVGKQRGYLISFEARRSLTAGNADEWYPVVPGSESLVVLALGKLAFAAKAPAAFASVDVAAACKAAGIPQESLQHVASLVATALRPLFIPGGNALSHQNGLQTAMQVLGLNAAAGMLGQPGGMFLSPAAPESSSFADVQKLVERMNAGQVQTLFIHGANPVFELPPSLGFVQALGKVKQVISFASFPDETALQSDWVIPDHTPLEGWGYQRSLAGANRIITSAAQPVVVPVYDTRATADVLLSAGKLPYRDEVDFIQKKIAPLLDRKDGNFTAPEIATFWAQFLQHGGWWANQPGLQAPQLAAGPLDQPAAAAQLKAPGENEFHLVTYPTQLGDGSGANHPWLQETPNPDTTVMWNSWVEINPATAVKLGVKDNDVVQVQSPSGTLEAVVYTYPAIRPDTVAMPFGQGHTALGRYAEGRGANPAAVLQPLVNQGGDLAFGDTVVKINPTGKRRPISRLESYEGVYGENNKPLNQ